MIDLDLNVVDPYVLDLYVLTPLVIDPYELGLVKHIYILLFILHVL